MFGKWNHFNQYHMGVDEFRRKRRLGVILANFACNCMNDQLDCGGDGYFEHPWESAIWELPKMKQLRARMKLVRGDACVLGLRDPVNHLPMQKKTGWLTTVSLLAKKLDVQCNRQHTRQQIEGSTGGFQRSVYAGIYWNRLVEILADGCESCFPVHHAHVVDESESVDSMLQDCLDVAPAIYPDLSLCSPCRDANIPDVYAMESRPDQVQSTEAPNAAARLPNARILSALRRLHVNLGHPSNRDLIRILKNRNATEDALRLARIFQCDICDRDRQPGIPLPASVSNNLDFNDQVCFDVLEIPNWEHGKKIKAANCLDHGTKFQIVSPLLEGDKGKSLRKAYVSSWKKWARPPRRVVRDPAKQNVAPSLADPLEHESTQIEPVASEAQWQNGDTEVHGGWWRRIFTKTLESVQPVDQDEWLERIDATAKNVLIRTSGYPVAPKV